MPSGSYIQYAGNNAHTTYIHLYAHIVPAAASLQETLVCFPDVCVSVCYFWHGCASEYTYRHTDKETHFYTRVFKKEICKPIHLKSKYFKCSNASKKYQPLIIRRLFTMTKMVRICSLSCTTCLCNWSIMCQHYFFSESISFSKDLQGTHRKAK